MQSSFYFIEEAEAYMRTGKLNMALKRFHGIAKVPSHLLITRADLYSQCALQLFDDHEEDQYDFHSYALRKYTFNAYIGFIKWEDELRAHPAYAHAALAAARVRDSTRFGLIQVTMLT